MGDNDGGRQIAQQRAQKAATVIGAVTTALGDLFDPALRRILLQVLTVTAALFVLIWLTAGTVLTSITWFETGWLNSLVDWVAGILGVGLGITLTFILFPPVATMVAGIFQDRIAAAVERRHYPALPAAPKMPITPVVLAGVRLVVWSTLINLVTLPLILATGFVLYFAVNGLLLGREYFEAVALRRMSPAAAARARRRNRGRIWLAGVAIAVVFWVPLLNLAGPVYGTALMVHIWERLRRRDRL